MDVVSIARCMMFSFGRHEEKNYLLRRVPCIGLRDNDPFFNLIFLTTLYQKKTLIEMWMYTRGCIQDMSSNEPVLVKIVEVVERWVTSMCGSGIVGFSIECTGYPKRET